MAVETLIKRTIYQVKCECGYNETWNDKPPREIQCPNCKRWLKPEPISWTGPDTFR